MKIQTPVQYNPRNEREYRNHVQRQLDNTHKKNQRLILTAPDGSKWAVEVDNAGVLSTSAVT